VARVGRGPIEKTMNTRPCLRALCNRPLRNDAYAARVAGEPQINGRNTNLLLLISDDEILGKNLRDTAEQIRLLVVHSAVGRAHLEIAPHHARRYNHAATAAVGGAVWQLRALRPGAVLLDLDLPYEAAWETADRLLELESCPPLILVTARRGQFDIGTAVRAGTIVDKSAGPAHLLRLASQASAQSGSGQIERNSIQRTFIRWLRPSGWSAPVTPACRFLGLNE
jgi:CheY-like chemotaxis protein